MLYLCQKYDTEHKISFPFDSDKYVLFSRDRERRGRKRRC